jgi:undecaprenyl-phosphate 4-deoxy-4-formamido-L-arabinose transferase
MNEKELSIVIPVYNEEESLAYLFAELFTALKDLPANSYEVIFVDDGSLDRSREILDEEYKKRNETMVVVMLDGNFGQHQAIMAAFSVARGKRLITLDADLQNPPCEILKIYKKMQEGYDYVGSIRDKRQDAFWRKFLSRINNIIREKITNIKLTDQGCMLRGYDRRVVKLMLMGQESSVYLPALGYSFARRPTEILVVHQARERGESKYSFFRLMRLNFDIMTVYSLVPIQAFSLLGIILAVLSGGFFFLLVIRRLIVGPEAEGVFTLFALLFFFIGICLFGLGILGEYIGRIYAEVRKRPRFLIQNVLRTEN